MFLAKVPVAAEASASVAAVTIPVAESDPAPVTPPPVPPVLGLIAALRSSTTASSAAPAARVIDLHDVKAIPYLSAAGREAYFDFLRYPLPRAFAISRNGGWGFGVRGTDPCTMALDNCERRGGPCHIYAFNQQVVPAVTGTP